MSTIKDEVKTKYGEAARRVASGEFGACCAPSCCGTQIDPITRDLYDSSQKSLLPDAAVKASLGCGNPTALAELKPGEIVLDLGSGGGIDVLLSARRVGPTGKAYGLDMTDEMLELARRNAPIVAERLSYANVEFRKGRIQDLALDLELLDRQLKENPITDAASFLAADELAEELRCKHPLIASESIDVAMKTVPPGTPS